MAVGVYPLAQYAAVEAEFLRATQPWPLLGMASGVIGRPAVGCMPRATLAAMRAGGVANPTVIDAAAAERDADARLNLIPPPLRRALLPFQVRRRVSGRGCSPPHRPAECSLTHAAETSQSVHPAHAAGLWFVTTATSPQALPTR
jgi:hypothetical protein